MSLVPPRADLSCSGLSGRTPPGPGKWVSDFESLGRRGVIPQERTRRGAEYGGMLRTDFTTDFHRQLATTEWLDRLHQTVDSLTAPWSGFEGSVHATYEQPRYLSSECAERYQFEVNLKQTLPSDCPIQRSLVLEFSYQDGPGRFELKRLQTGYHFRQFQPEVHLEPCRALGLLGENQDWPLGPELAGYDPAAREMAFEWNVVPLGQRDGIWRLGMADLSNLPRWSGRYLPVLLSEQQVAEARFKIFGDRIPVEDVYVRVVALPTWQSVPASPAWAKPSLELNLRTGPDTLRLEMNPSGLSLNWQSGSQEQHRVWPVTPELYNHLMAEGRRALTVDYPGQGRMGLDGQDWTLVVDGQSRFEWMPYSGPFLDICIKLLETAGVELEITRRPELY